MGVGWQVNSGTPLRCSPVLLLPRKMPTEGPQMGVPKTASLTALCQDRNWAPEQRFPIWGFISPPPPQKRMSIFMQFLGSTSVLVSSQRCLRPSPLQKATNYCSRIVRLNAGRGGDFPSTPLVVSRKSALFLKSHHPAPPAAAPTGFSASLPCRDPQESAQTLMLGTQRVFGGR